MRIASIALCAAAAACATGGRGNAIWIPPESLSSDEAVAQIEECARTLVPPTPMPQPYVNYSGGAAAIAGSAFVAGLARGLAEGEARRTATMACMIEQGFVPVKLTDEQRAQWEALPDGAESAAYIEALAAPDRELISRKLAEDGEPEPSEETANERPSDEGEGQASPAAPDTQEPSAQE